MSAPVLAATATALDASAAATSITVNKPTGTASGDLLLASVTLRISSATITPPAGWTQVASGGASSITLATFIKVAGGSEPSSYTFTTSLAGRQAAGIDRITGADPITPVDVHSSASGTAATSLVAAAVDPSSADTLLVACFGFSTGTATVTNPGGMTSDWSFTASAVSAAPVNAAAHETLSVDTSTGTRTATASTSGNWAAQLLVIQPPGVPTGFTGWGVPI